MKRGTVVWVDLSDTSPPEMGKVRPGIVVSGTAHNEALNTVVVVPTSSIAPEIWPLRMAVGHFAGKESYAVIPGIRQVRKGRLRGALGDLSHEQLARLNECLDAYLR
ncbi:MAG: type II toxin-antitoxin system PemK/MazF family toxin [Opitutaceae bacterium]|nr:type II toxin-antitoxin system PemK/MazF family toxin [Opitutaceae bacterium]